MAVTAAMVKELREMTGAGMMDCKKALAATDGDMDKAVEFLREKGLAGATKKAGRIAAEGIVMTKVTADEKKAVVVEVNAETDFVAKNEKFPGGHFWKQKCRKKTWWQQDFVVYTNS